MATTYDQSGDGTGVVGLPAGLQFAPFVARLFSPGSPLYYLYLDFQADVLAYRRPKRFFYYTRARRIAVPARTHRILGGHPYGGWKIEVRSIRPLRNRLSLRLLAWIGGVA